MIYPRKFQLTDIFQFKSRSFEYKPGVTVVTAPNGSGKTNMFEQGQFFAWSGIIPGSVSKEDMVKWGEKQGGTEVTFEDECDIKYRLSRKVPGSKVNLDWIELDGTRKAVTKNTEISEWLEQKLGMSLKMFQNVSFIRQGTFMKVVSDRQTRIQHFNKLTDTLKYEDMRKLLVSARSDIPELADYSVEIKNLEVQLDTSEEEYEKAENLWKELKQKREGVKEDERKANAIKAKPDADPQIEQKLKIKREELSRLSEAVPEEPEKVANPSVSRESLEEIKSKSRKRAYKQEDLQNKESQLKVLEEPVLRIQLTCDEEVLEMKRGLRRAAKLSEEHDECVLCSQKLPEDFSSEAFDKKAKEAGEELEKLREFKNKYTLYLQEKKRLEYEIETINQWLTNHPESHSAEKIALLEKELETYDERVKAYNEASASRNEAVRRVDEKKTEIEKLEHKFNNFANNDEKQWAEEVILKVQGIDTELASASEEKTNKYYARDNLKSQLTKLKASQKNKENVDKKKTLLIKSAEHLKYNCLPMKIMQPFLSGFNPRLSHFLNYFDVDYTCRMTSDFRFEFNRGFGWKSADKSMSGGQLVNLALSIYLTTMDILSPANPILTMDEPTDSLDEARKTGLINALLQLNAVNKNLYVIIISHDEDIQAAADHHIELEIPYN